MIGRDASSHPDVVAGSHRAGLLIDADSVVFRHHLAITLGDSTITVADFDDARSTPSPASKRATAPDIQNRCQAVRRLEAWIRCR